MPADRRPAVVQRDRDLLQRRRTSPGRHPLPPRQPADRDGLAVPHAGPTSLAAQLSSNVAVVGNAVGQLKAFEPEVLAAVTWLNAEKAYGLGVYIVEPASGSPAGPFRRPPGRGEIARLLRQHGLHPSKALGQHFVTDPNTVERIARLARVGARRSRRRDRCRARFSTVALAATGAKSDLSRGGQGHRPAPSGDRRRLSRECAHQLRAQPLG